MLSVFLVLCIFFEEKRQEKMFFVSMIHVLLFLRIIFHFSTETGKDVSVVSWISSGTCHGQKADTAVFLFFTDHFLFSQYTLLP